MFQAISATVRLLTAVNFCALLCYFALMDDYMTIAVDSLAIEVSSQALEVVGFFGAGNTASQCFIAKKISRRMGRRWQASKKFDAFSKAVNDVKGKIEKMRRV
jgi:hypothetical protein